MRRSISTRSSCAARSMRSTPSSMRRSTMASIAVALPRASRPTKRVSASCSRLSARSRSGSVVSAIWPVTALPKRICDCFRPWFGLTRSITVISNAICGASPTITTSRIICATSTSCQVLRRPSICPGSSSAITAACPISTRAVSFRSVRNSISPPRTTARGTAASPKTDMDAYLHPDYYEIALAPDDPVRELDFFETAIVKFSARKVHRVFELGAGTAPYLEEWHRRGYAYSGLDLSPAMLEFARDKARRKDIDATFVFGDMRELDRGLGPFDLAYVLLGSLYVRSNREFLDHLERVADILLPGGLYLLDSFVWFRIFHDYRRSWTRRKNGVRVHTRYRAEIVDPVAQTYNECLTFTVDDRGKNMTIEGRVPAKVFFPQEFLCLVEASGRFEFIGWYNDFSFTTEIKPEGR